MTIPNMVPTVHTRLLAARLIEACQRPDTTGTDAVHQYLFACTKGQEVALVAAILDHATNHNTATSSDNNEAETLDLNLVCLGAVAAAAGMYGVTHQQVLRGTRRGTDVPARRVAMTVAHLAGGGYSEIGRFFNKDHSTVVTGVKWCLATPAAYAIAEQAFDALRVEMADRDSDSAEMEG